MTADSTVGEWLDDEWLAISQRHGLVRELGIDPDMPLSALQARLALTDADMAKLDRLKMCSAEFAPDGTLVVQYLHDAVTYSAIDLYDWLDNGGE